MTKLYFLLVWSFLVFSFGWAQQGFDSLTNLDAISVSTTTGEKPQAKVWNYDGQHWAVLPNSSGTFLWRLEGTSWKDVLKLSSKSSSKADCKMVGNIVHVLLFQGSASQLVTLEYDQSHKTYDFWSKRTSTVGLKFKSSTETATIDMDGDGRMWLAYDGSSEIYTVWSDAPYKKWSSPVTVATGITTDDICAVISLPGQIGILWSNQNSKRFGFKTHNNGESPGSWSEDEVPASQSAVNTGHGMADDHMNMAVATDGTLYCAVKTSYDNSSYPEIALLVRHASGSWDKLYEVSSRGTRPLVILNEALKKLRVVYTSQDGGGNIVYNESSADKISFGSQKGLMSGTYDNSTSTKANFNAEIVILASSNNKAVGVLARDAVFPSLPEAPQLSSPQDLATDISTTATLSWAASQGAEYYRAQVSLTADFASKILDQDNIATTSVSASRLLNATVYYWRVRASNSAGNSVWSSVRSFTTAPAAPVVVGVPQLSSPQNLATGVSTTPIFSWTASQGAEYYRAQVSLTADFASKILDQDNIATTSVSASGLLNATVYYWRVRASNTAGNSDWSALWSFTTAPVSPSGGDIVADWKMDENGGSALVDVSGYGNNASISGSPGWVSGVVGTALHFNGSNQYATAADASSLDLSQSLTVSAWIKPDRRATQYLIKKADQDNIDGYELSLSSNGYIFFRFNQRTAGDTYRLNSVANYPNNGNTWMHVAASYDGSAIRIYINGNLDAVKSVSSPVTVNNNQMDLTLGAGNGGYRGFQGAMDEVRIYKVALTAQQIAELVSPSSTPLAEVPLLQSPLNHASDVSTSPVLSWGNSKGADSYSLQVSTSGNFSSLIFDQQGITGTSVSVPNLDNASTYYWRVRAANSAGMSNWSSVWNFTVAPQPASVAAIPVLQSPANSATNVSTSPNLSWLASAGAETYRVQLSSDSGFSALIFDQSGLVNTSVQANNLSAESAYYWRVRASNSAGNSDWSSAWNFTTAPVLPSGGGDIVADWEMDENGGSTLVDASGYGNNARISGSPGWVSGVVGTALRFNGSNQYATAADASSLDLSQGLTISAWIKPEKLATQYLIKKADQDNIDGYELSLSSKGYVFFRFNQRTAGDAYRLNSIATYPTNGSTWIHVAVTYDGSAIRLYINGNQNAVKNISSPVTVNNNQLDLTLGAGNNGYRGFQGAIDEVRIYNVTLSSSEIAALANPSQVIAATTKSLLEGAKKLLQEEQTREIAQEFIVYPNPFRSEVYVRLSFIQDSQYSLILYDNKGMMIQQVKSGPAKGGETYTIPIVADFLPQGTYLLRLKVKGHSQTLRLLRA
ncbi:MAG: LamG-like jellyroll fold domain-containing protein [Salegentibacter sp.]